LNLGPLLVRERLWSVVVYIWSYTVRNVHPLGTFWKDSYINWTCHKEQTLELPGDKKFVCKLLKLAIFQLRLPDPLFHSILNYVTANCKSNGFSYPSLENCLNLRVGVFLSILK
jgi:hypothetical protein